MDPAGRAQDVRDPPGATTGRVLAGRGKCHGGYGERAPRRKHSVTLTTPRPQEKSDDALDKTLTTMSKLLLLKMSSPELWSETKFLGTLFIKTDRGFRVKSLGKLYDSLLISTGLQI